MSDANLWWLMSGLAVIVELLTGTFYLLMLALGLAAAAIAALLGFAVATQLVVAAVVGGGFVGALTFLRRKRLGDPSARAQRSVNLDVGETIQIADWGPDGTASVKYRGANWTAIPRPGVSTEPGAHRVAELVGNRLLVDKI